MANLAKRSLNVVGSVEDSRTYLAGRMEEAKSAAAWRSFPVWAWAGPGFSNRRRAPRTGDVVPGHQKRGRCRRKFKRRC